MAEEKVCLGAIVGVHGIRGEVKVKSFSDDERHLTRYGVLENEVGDKTFEVKIVGDSEELLRCKIKGVEDRNTAETLVGTGLYVARDKLPDLADDEYYHTDLIRLEAKNKQGELVGTVNAVYNFGAGDVIEIKRADDKSLEMVPFTAQFVPDINIKNHYIIVEMMTFAKDEEEANEG
ncbi:MAG: ribosome maturation factor RimM [Alphaproteobacteria bacterium]|nr:ribosome maturation factor RimM [Alphaproteobacteria bacterium]